MAWQDNYDQVEDRLAKFWKDNPNGRVYTEHLDIRDDHTGIIIKAYVYADKEDINPVATGIAEDHHSKVGANVTSWIENAETSAIGRALANWTYQAKKRPSVTEMEKVERGNTTSASNSGSAKKQQDIFTPPQSVQKKTVGAVKESDVANKPIEQKLEATGFEVEEKKIVTQGTVVPQCLSCSSELWDNREDKASGKIKPTFPDWKCKNKECDNGKPRIYYMESYAADKTAPEEWYMPAPVKAKSMDEVTPGQAPF